MSRKIFAVQSLSLCAIAVALNGTAQAQSSVTLFGVLDGGLLYTNKTLDPATGANAGKQVSMIDGGSYYSQFDRCA